jgi:hypothetical protein
MQRRSTKPSKIFSDKLFLSGGKKTEAVVSRAENNSGEADGRNHF